MWYESTFWQGGEQWLRVGKDWHHPGERGPSVRRFLAPADGTLTITGRVYKAHRDGDGVRVAILHNGQQVWQHELEGKDGEGVDPNLSVAVKQGDTLRFRRRQTRRDRLRHDPLGPGDHLCRRAEISGIRRVRCEEAGRRRLVLRNAGRRPRRAGHAAAGLVRRRLGVVREAAVGRPSGRVDKRCGAALAVLADGQDASGVVLAFEAARPWRLQAELATDGKLTVRLIVMPAAEDAAAPPAGQIAPAQPCSPGALLRHVADGTADAGPLGRRSWA